MKLFGICPHCQGETEIENTNACYCMCQSCGKMYGIMGNAKIEGAVLSENRELELHKEIEKDVRHRVSNWRYE